MRICEECGREAVTEYQTNCAHCGATLPKTSQESKVAEHIANVPEIQVEAGETPKERRMILLFFGLAPGIICALIYIIVQFQDFLEYPEFLILITLISIAISSIPALIGWFIGRLIDRRTGRIEVFSFGLGLLFALPGDFITLFYFAGAFWRYGHWGLGM